MALRHQIRDLASKIAPGLMLELLSWRSQRLIMRIERDRGWVDASKKFIEKHGSHVLNGPFKGMEYPSRTIEERNLIPKLVGSYEDELSKWVERIAKDQYPELLNIGSADGYYTVGFALRSPATRVIAFDTDLWARRATRELARKNSANNVAVLSRCDPKWLNNHLKADSILLVDCEGYEEVLLDVEKVPTLRNCDVLVELHPHVVPDVQKTLEDRFRTTHSIEVVESRPKNHGDYSWMADVDQTLRTEIISEGRHKPQQWLLLTRKK